MVFKTGYTVPAFSNKVVHRAWLMKFCIKGCFGDTVLSLRLSSFQRVKKYGKRDLLCREVTYQRLGLTTHSNKMVSLATDASVNHVYILV